MTSTNAPSASGGQDAPRPAIDWTAALAEHDRWLRTVVFARVGEAQAVDEVMQEVALAVVRGKAPLADVKKLAPWLYQLAVRQSLMYRRKMGRGRKMVERFVERFQPTEQDRRTTDPLDWLLNEERGRLIRSDARASRAGRRNFAAEVHRGLGLSRFDGTPGH